MLPARPSNPSHSAVSRRPREEGGEKRGREEGSIPFTTPAGVSRRTVVTGRLAIGLQVAGGGESVPDGHTYHEDAWFGEHGFIFANLILNRIN